MSLGRAGSIPVSPIRIDLIATDLAVGGAERCVAALAIELAKAGESPRVISLFGPPEPQRRGIIDRLRAGGIPVEHLDFRRPHQVFRGWRNLKRLIEQDRPAAAIAFLFHATTLATRMYPPRGVPLIEAVRLADTGFTRRAISRVNHRQVKKIVAVSQGVAEHVVRRENADPSDVIVIPNGIDLAAWDQQASQPPLMADALPERFLLFVGRYHYQKRVEWLARLADAGPLVEAGIQIAIAGGGPQQNLMKSAIASGRIIDLGHRGDIAALMQRAEMLLLPSRYEGMPNVVLEAMASGRAVVACDVEGVRDLLGDNDASVAAAMQIASRDDYADFQAKVLQLAASDQLRNHIGLENRRRCVERFQLQDKLDLYRDLLRAAAENRL